MKYILSLLLVGALFLPIGAYADEATYQESWKFLYRFDLTWQNGQLSQVQRYAITTGDAPTVPTGSWSLRVLNSQGHTIALYPFEPAVLAVGGRLELIVPAENSGTTARFSDAAGVEVLSIDLRESRVCNDDGVCSTDVGERSENCPTDCGAAVAGTDITQTAAIAPQLNIGGRVGGILLKLSMAAAGMMLLVGASRLLDSRNHP